ncbi:carbohydrate-binding domain-containing protein, partial [Ancrocorticia populi]|uniref:carbohydrate-binding domain-containing protein n=1 Tax=Ancrocorticia populi TaxID=2175228 RepID=UPI003F9EB0ED
MTLSNRFSERKWTSHNSKNTAAFVTLALASAVTLSACSSDSDEASADETATESTAVAITDVSNLEDATHYSESDADFEEAHVTEIALDGDTVSASGANSDGVAAQEADGEAVITVTGGGTYRFSGELSGHVVITADSEEDVQVILNGATITSDTDAAVSITEADEATVIVADGTENTLTDGSTRNGQTAEEAEAAEATEEATDDESFVANAALYLKADLTITGMGQLTVDGTYEDGIHSKDGLVITGPNVTVEDADDGIIGKDYLVLVDGTVDITSVDTGFGSDNEDDADRGWLS